MSYDQNIPQPTDNLSQSQGDLLANFQQLDTSFAVEHTAFSVNSNVGLHKQITFPAMPSVIPSPATTFSAMYPNKDSTSTNQEMFWANALFKGATAIQVTNSALLATAGNGMMPGGLEIRSGSASANGAGFPNNFTPQFPVACIAVVAIGTNPLEKTNLIKATIKANDKFTLQSFNAMTGGSGNAEACWFIAIGY
jgi:hypothetical protein